MTVYIQGQVLDVVSKPYSIDDERGTRSGVSHQLMLYTDGDLCRVSLADELAADNWRKRVGELVKLRCKLFSSGKLRLVLDGAAKTS